MDASGRSYSLLQHTFAICRMDKNASLPDWAVGGEFWSVSRTPDELSVVCPQGSVPADVDHEAGWKCLKVDSPFEFDLAGMISCMAAPLAEADDGPVRGGNPGLRLPDGQRERASKGPRAS
jgi:hypothetical protein